MGTTPAQWADYRLEMHDGFELVGEPARLVHGLQTRGKVQEDLGFGVELQLPCSAQTGDNQS